MNSQPRPAALFDAEVELGNGYALAEAVETDGTTSYWLVTDRTADDLGCCCRDCAPHEGVGRLPAETRARIATCGGTTRDGTRCRRPTAPGERCPWHRKEAGP